MKEYQFTKDQLSLIERMRQPFAVYQFLDKRVVTLALSDGFCELFGYDDRAGQSPGDAGPGRGRRQDYSGRKQGVEKQFGSDGEEGETWKKKRKTSQ